MDIGKIGQGGQISFDNTALKVENPKTGGSGVKSEVAIPSTNTTEDKTKVDEKELQQAIDKLSKFIADENTKIEYQYHSKFNDLMIKIINKDTNEVILEVPPKKILDLVAKMMEMVGILFDKKA